jgi:predicted  nucleic acid-binding Zn-ribbon protein
MSRTSVLFRLQEIDLELDSHRARLQGIEQELSGNPAVNLARQQASAARERFNASRVQARSAELEVQALGEKIAEAEKRLYSGAITNPKELRDLEQDLASLRRRCQGLEEQQLDAMIAAESAEGQMLALETQLQQTEAAALQAQGALMEERQRLQDRVSELSGEREALAGTVLTEDQQLYGRLRQSKHGRALAKVAEGNCAACGEEVSSSLLQEVRRGATLVRCGSCERILYAGSD